MGESTTDSFTYTSSDGNGGTATAIVTVIVTGVNDASMATNDMANSTENTAVTILVLANDRDVDGDALTVGSISQGANGTVAIANNGTAVTYTANAAFAGTDSFTYTVSDGHGGTATAMVTVTIANVNDAPVAAEDMGTTSEGMAITLEVFANDFDLDGDVLTVEVVTQGANGTVTITASGTAVTYAPDVAFLGTDAFTYTVSDGNGGMATAMVTVTVSELPEPGPGGLYPGQKFSVGSVPLSVAVADLNADGRPDLVTANFNSDNVSILLGQGGATFEAQEVFAAGDGAFSVAVADLSGDDLPDLVITNLNANNVSVLLGRGDGTFQPQQHFAVGELPSSVAVADVNRDGFLDLVVANSSNANDVSVLLGRGDGTFLPQQRFAVGRGPFSVVMADLNEDGRPDMAVANGNSNAVSVLLHQ